MQTSLSIINYQLSIKEERSARSRTLLFHMLTRHTLAAHCLCLAAISYVACMQHKAVNFNLRTKVVLFWDMGKGGVKKMRGAVCGG